MNRGDFGAGIEIRVKATGQVGTLCGTEQDWICAIPSEGQLLNLHVQPEDVDPVASFSTNTK